MIISNGLDLVHVPRFAAVIERRPGMVARLFTEAEALRSDRSPRDAASLAARFAAKEAVAKALGAPGGLSWHDCQVITAASGRPVLVVDGSVAVAALRQGIHRWHLSLTHDGEYAGAHVIAEGSPQ